MSEKVKIRVSPTACVYHDRKEYTIEVELAGVDKKDIDFEMSETSFCLKAFRNDVEYFGCWVLSHDIDPNKAKATFKNGLLTVIAPLAKPLKGVKVSIK